MKEYTIKWTHCGRYSEYQGYTVIEAESEDNAERKFFQTRPEMNPLNGRFTGYIIERIF